MPNECPKGMGSARLLGLMAGVLLAVGCAENGSSGEVPEVSASKSALEAGGPPAKSKDAGTTRTVWVLMNEQANVKGAASIKGWRARGSAVYKELTGVANASQGSVRSFLAQRKAKVRPFWIVNALRVEADDDTISQLSKRPDVARVLPERIYWVPPVEKGQPPASIDQIEWGLESVRVPEVWDEFGVKGAGIVVANIDTGVQFDHPALVNQYRGTQSAGVYDHNYNWFDPTYMCGEPEDGPCDNAGHGTHTMGTMVGDDGDPGENQIGVAPHAKWIAAKGCEDFWCSEETLLAAAEWVLAPTDVYGENPRPDLRPQVVNNSWGGWGGDPLFQPVVEAWVAAGIFPAFSAGNDGPACGTAGSPGDYPESYAAGAYDEFEEIAFFSSRGPSLFEVMKPNIAAPGVDVRSSVPYDDYDWYSGTSMASPHVAGTVALMWEAAPALFGDIETTRTLLDSTAVDMEDLSCGGTAENNNVWGEGRLDAYAAVEASPRGPTGTLAGTVTDLGGMPLSGVRIVASSPEWQDRSTTSDETGGYDLLLSVGEYDVTASLFGFLTETVTGISIVEGMATTQDFALTAAPSHAVSGQVTDAEGAPLQGVTVTILSTPIPPAVTDEAGQYQFSSVPDGAYQISASAGRCFEQQTQDLIVDGDVTVDFELAARTDSFGYSCSEVPFEYVEAQNVLIQMGDDESVSVTLPFQFTFYGQTYDSVNVNINGFLHFVPATPYSGLYWNTPIPDPNEPNGAIYALWDDLFVFPEFGGSILTDTIGEAPNRVFVVEWRDAFFYDDWEAEPVSFEILLHENGRITFQYLTGDTRLQRGGSATIGVEDEEGSVGFEYSYNQETVNAGTAIRYTLPPSGFIEGQVTDANDGLPIAKATVRALIGETQVRAVKTNADGQYRLQVPVGSYEIEASRKNYASAQVSLSVDEDEIIAQDFVLQTANATASPGAFQLVLLQGEQRTRELTIENTGTLPLEWETSEAGGRRQNVVSKAALERNPDANPNAHDTRNLYAVDENAPGWNPNAPGDVLASFAPQGMGLAWGVGFTGNIWLSDAFNISNVEFAVDGVPTGASWPASWSGGWPADMAFDPTRGLVCQVAVGGDNGIHCWDPATGIVSYAITGSPWSGISQRGVAYRDDDDTFYIGGWNEGVIYHVAGESHPEPGAVIDECRPSDGDISGLAWNSSAGVLWMATNSPTDTIYELAEDCTVLATFPHPTPGFNGAGIEMDESGNLWTIGQLPNMAYLIESGVPAFSDVSWLSAVPEAGVLEPGQSQTVEVTIDTAELQSGVYLASLFVRSNSGRNAALRIPVSLVVTEYRQGVDSGGNMYIDADGDTWSQDQRYSAGGWGYVQKSKATSSKDPVTGTDDPLLYESQRVSPYAYRFDNVPNGVYQVELRFAELKAKQKIGKRLFDVVVEDTLVLPAHDIVYEVGTLAADDYVFFVEVVDSQVDVRFIELSGYDAPVINALRVTHRPDR